MLSLLGEKGTPLGAPLPGVPGSSPGAIPPVYSETFLRATAHGWAALRAISDQRHRYIRAPRPELYDVLSDPGETRNLVAGSPDVAMRLHAALDALERSGQVRDARPVEPDEEVSEMLRSLGYLSGATSRGTRDGTLDPKDGVVLAREYERARERPKAGRGREARRELEGLVKRNPNNVPFLSAYVAALQATGDAQRAVDVLRRAVELNPGNDVLHRRLGDAHRQVGSRAEARSTRGPHVRDAERYNRYGHRR